ncbi:Rv3235 family protein [Streptomyces sp. NPDC000961]|uniref:Rv3235 family protein n=1 Tax=Streptomyces sp. NPDC000961 TaxID=3364541 RepID=UPI003693182A
MAAGPSTTTATATGPGTATATSPGTAAGPATTPAATLMPTAPAAPATILTTTRTTPAPASGGGRATTPTTLSPAPADAPATTPAPAAPTPTVPAQAQAPAPTAAATRRAPRPRTAPGGPAGTRPRGAAGARPRTAGRGVPRALPPHTVFAERLLAVLSGERPVHWMLGHTLGEAYEQLVRLAPETPLRSLGPRPVLRRCSVQAHPAQGAVEAFATVATGARVRAMAFRLERGADLRWRCAAVELDGLGAAAAHRT